MGRGDEPIGAIHRTSPARPITDGRRWRVTAGALDQEPSEASMATKPTRPQQQAGDHLAEALVLITGAARLDGRGTLDRGGLAEIAGRLARVSSAIGLDEIVARALERRGKALGLPADT